MQQNTHNATAARSKKNPPPLTYENAVERGNQILASITPAQVAVGGLVIGMLLGAMIARRPMMGGKV